MESSITPVARAKELGVLPFLASAGKEAIAVALWGHLRRRRLCDLSALFVIATPIMVIIVYITQKLLGFEHDQNEFVKKRYKRTRCLYQQGVFMFGGYTGKILWVDLSKQKIRSVNLDEGTAEKYIGGVGLAAKILWDETTVYTSPFSPENPLLFMVGPLTGTMVPSSSHCTIAAISPLTNIWGQAHVGGTWPDELKKAGFDGIVIRGIAKKPTYLWIKDGGAEIMDAAHLWGKDSYDVDRFIKKDKDEKASVLMIGSAGEKLVRIAAIMGEGATARAAGRCGLGAVMGSKRLKAVAVRGTLSLRINDEEALRENIRKVLPKLVEKSVADHKEKYASIVRKSIKTGDVPIKNWLQGTFEGFLEKELKLLSKSKPYHCRRCITSCVESRMTAKGRQVVLEGINMLGAMCLIDNMEALNKAYELCNRLGLDVISTGATIAFAMECFEKGLITKDDTEDIDLRWGNDEAMVEIVRKIGERKGFGKLLGEGVRRAANEIGGLAYEYAIHVKGLELPAHDPRAYSSMAVGYATANRGACHLEGHTYPLEKRMTLPELGYPQLVDRFETKGKGILNAKMQNFMCMLDSLVVCQFLFSIYKVQPSRFVEWINYVTGWSMDLHEFMMTGERIFNLKRMFNVRRGISRKDDTLPPRLLTHKRGGTAAENLPDLGEMLSEYYAYRGWSEEGIPTEKKLRELNISFAASHINPLRKM